MLFKINHDVPANTTAAAPVWQKLQVCQGTIEEWNIFCPEAVDEDIYWIAMKY